MEHAFFRKTLPLSGGSLPLALALLAILLFLLGGCTARETKPRSYLDSTGVEFVLIPAGSFTMGCDSGETGQKCGPGETPAHKVTISKSFYLGKYEVTQGQWKDVMCQPGKPEHCHVTGKNNPSTGISWDEAQSFIEKLNAKEPNILIDGKRHRYALPTEAQWEYAERAGSRTEWFCGAESSCLDRHMYFLKNNAPYGTQLSTSEQPVGQKLPNAWGLYDMQGSVLEWVADPPRPYGRGHEHDPVGETAKHIFSVEVLWLDGRATQITRESARVLRGGSAYDIYDSYALKKPEQAREYAEKRFAFASARRFMAYKGSNRGGVTGFRLALVEE